MTWHVLCIRPYLRKRVGEYQKAGVLAGPGANAAFTTDEDF
jgi:hypothetical protein